MAFINDAITRRLRGFPGAGFSGVAQANPANDSGFADVAGGVGPQTINPRQIPSWIGAPFVPGGEFGMNLRVREIGEAVRRRLQELVGGGQAFGRPGGLGF